MRNRSPSLLAFLLLMSAPAALPAQESPRFATFRQGDWGQPCTAANRLACLRDLTFHQVFPEGLEVGQRGEGRYRYVFRQVADIERLLPSNGEPSTLPRGGQEGFRASGRFGGQLVAARLNVAFNDAGLMSQFVRARSGAKLAAHYFRRDVAPALVGRSVRQVLNYCDRVISGEFGVVGPERAGERLFDVDGDGAPDVSLDDLVKALQAVNTSFLPGRRPGRALSPKAPPVEEPLPEEETGDVETAEEVAPAAEDAEAPAAGDPIEEILEEGQPSEEELEELEEMDEEELDRELEEIEEQIEEGMEQESLPEVPEPEAEEEAGELPIPSPESLPPVVEDAGAPEGGEALPGDRAGRPRFPGRDRRPAAGKDRIPGGEARFVSFSMRDWGRDRSDEAGGGIRDRFFRETFPEGLILGDRHGIDRDGEFAIVLQTPADLAAFLPAEAPARTLTADALNPREGNVLAGQLAAAKLNLMYNRVRHQRFGVNPNAFGELRFVDCVDEDLIGRSVAEVVRAADAALSGRLGAVAGAPENGRDFLDADRDGTPDLSLNDLVEALGVINSNFRQGDAGCLRADRPGAGESGRGRGREGHPLGGPPGQEGRSDHPRGGPPGQRRGGGGR